MSDQKCLGSKMCRFYKDGGRSCFTQGVLPRCSPDFRKTAGEIPYSHGTWYYRPELGAVMVDEKMVANVFVSDTTDKEMENNGYFIARAMNVCLDLNPENPLAAINTIPEMAKLVKAIKDYEKDGLDRWDWIQQQVNSIISKIGE